jgi:lipopolysaccharide/colanic/teichoic acid biosynthesis glycosyltransferase
MKQSYDSLEQFNQTLVANHLAESGRVTKGGSLPSLGSTTNIIQIASALSGASARTVPWWKAPLDMACILLALPLWLPLILLLMLVTRIASPGPVFYRQKRVGLGGKHFSLWKFRTMKVNTETQTHERYFEELIRTNRVMTKLDTRGDPRLAPFGRILRATGLDELPQIFNVLWGDMSLVGPRPCLPNEFASYQPWQRERVNGLPGLTGFWQVSGKNKTTFNEMIRMDVFYLNNMSLLLDLKIMLKTATAIAGEVLESQQAKRRVPQTQSPKIPLEPLLATSSGRQR